MRRVLAERAARGEQAERVSSTAMPMKPTANLPGVRRRGTGIFSSPSLTRIPGWLGIRRRTSARCR